MSCCGGRASAPRFRRGSGTHAGQRSRRMDQTWRVTYPNGDTKDITGGSGAYLQAMREAAAHGGSVRQIVTPRTNEKGKKDK